MILTGNILFVVVGCKKSYNYQFILIISDCSLFFTEIEEE